MRSLQPGICPGARGQPSTTCPAWDRNRTTHLQPLQAAGHEAKPRLPPPNHPPHLAATPPYPPLSFPRTSGAGFPATPPPQPLGRELTDPPGGIPSQLPLHPPCRGAKARPLGRARSPPAGLGAPQQGSGSRLLAPSPRDPPPRLPPGARYLGAGPPAALSPPPPSGLPGAGSAAAGWAARAVPHRYKRKPSPGGRKRRLRHLRRARLGRPAPAGC